MAELKEKRDWPGDAEGRAACSKAPLRVLIVAPSFDILGGQAVQAARLFERLQKETSLEVGFLPINPPMPGFLRTVQNVKYVRSIRTTLLYWTALFRRVHRYDVIHVFSASYLSFVLSPTPAILVARSLGKKIVLNYRSGQAEDHLRRWRRSLNRTLRLIDEIAVPSGYLVDVFARFGWHARAIFNFVDTERFRFRERRPLRPRFLSNRNLEPLYNVGCILRAFSIIQRRFPEARLTVAGDGSQRGELEKLARDLGLRDTEFIGRIAPEKMSELYEAADIYLNSPNIDNMPGSVIEAFASGTPVVTTDAGGIPYIVTDEETGMLVRCDDHEMMAQKAIRLLEDEKLSSKLAGNGREECSKYSWDSVRDEWLKLYHELMMDETAAPKNERTVGRRSQGSASVDV